MITDYIDSMLGEGTPHSTSKGMQYSYKCPLCDDHKERLFINVDRKVFKCHNCDEAGTLITFMSIYNHITWHDALDIFREYEGYEQPLPEDIEEEIYSKLIKVPPIEVPKFVHPLPEEFILMEDAKGKAGKEAMRYLRSRGVTMSMAERYYIGYCAEGKYANRIIMPDFEDNELIYWQARTWEPEPKLKLLKKHFRKVLNPSLSDEQLSKGIVQVGKSEVVSNLDFIKEEGMAVLCEGKMDAFTLGDIGGCIHGKSMSDTQFTKLVKNKDKIDVIYVMMDGDAFTYTVNIAKRLSRYFDDVYVCKIPEDKDPNTLGRKGCLEAITKAVKFDMMFEVRATLKGWI